MVNPLVELYTLRSIARAVKTALPTVDVREPGFRREPPETTEQWVTIDPLSIQPSAASRRAIWDGSWLFQVSCFSKIAELRADNLADAPWLLSGPARGALEKSDVLVYTYGDVATVLLGALEIGPAAQVYLAERNIDQYPNDVHAVALTFTGRLKHS